VTLDTLTLGGIDSALLIDAPAKLIVTATGSDGRPFPGIPTFTSSDPNVVNVSADGTLTVKHLNLKPITLTATENGKSATVNVDTYGLDATGGTFQTPTSNNISELGYNFILAFRDANGDPPAVDAFFDIQGPTAFNVGAPVVRSMNKGATVQGYAWIRDPSVPIISGTYTASGTVAGVIYSKTFTLNAAQVQAIASDVNVEFDAFGYTVTGTLPAGSPLSYGVLYSEAQGKRIGNLDSFMDLPFAGRFDQPLTKGTYYIGVFAQSYHEERHEAFPDQINVSAKLVESIVDPNLPAHNNKN